MSDERAMQLIGELGKPNKAVVRKIDGFWWLITQRPPARMIAYPGHITAFTAAHMLEVFYRRPQ